MRAFGTAGQRRQQTGEAVRIVQARLRLEPEAPAPVGPSAHPAVETLQARVNLLGHEPVGQGGPLARGLRLARQVARKLLLPWLHRQTLFNESVVEAVEVARAEALAARLHARDVRAELLGLLQAADERLAQYHDTTVNRELGPGGRLARGGLWFEPAVAVALHDGRPEVVAVTPRVLEQIFVHTRLPPPPTRVLVLGCQASSQPLELASFGYTVSAVDRRPPRLRHPNLAVLQADLDRLPLADAAFDCVVSAGAVAEACRVLRPGGRLLLTVPFGRPAPRVYGPAGLDALLAGFRVVERRFGVRDGEHWSLTTAEVAAEAESAERVSAVALVVAEKP